MGFVWFYLAVSRMTAVVREGRREDGGREGEGERETNNTEEENKKKCMDVGLLTRHSYHFLELFYLLLADDAIRVVALQVSFFSSSNRSKTVVRLDRQWCGAAKSI